MCKTNRHTFQRPSTLFGRLVDAALKEKEKTRSSSESLDKTPDKERSASRQDAGSTLR